MVGERTVVALRVSGNFPGGPVPLSYFTALCDGKISALTVLPGDSGGGPARGSAGSGA